MAFRLPIAINPCAYLMGYNGTMVDIPFRWLFRLEELHEEGRDARAVRGSARYARGASRSQER